MAQSLAARVVGITGADPLFARIRQEAEEAIRREPELALFLSVNVLNHHTLEGAVSHRVASPRDSSIGEAFHADIMAVADRDPACLRMIEPLLYFKGFQALQAYRLSHWLLKAGKRTGKETGDRHPKIRHGVLIGAGAKILGNIEIGYCARVAAGSVVLHPVPHNKTVAGVPARIVGEAGCAEPSRDMNQILAEKALEA
jgi:serine O-acetyltransferase